MIIRQKDFIEIVVTDDERKVHKKVVITKKNGICDVFVSMSGIHSNYYYRIISFKENDLRIYDDQYLSSVVHEMVFIESCPTFEDIIIEEIKSKSKLVVHKEIVEKGWW